MHIFGMRSKEASSRALYKDPRGVYADRKNGELPTK